MENTGRATWLLGALVLIILLAGCGALDVGGDDADREPYDVDDHTPSSSDELNPGLTDEAVTDQWALLDAHAEVLAEQSYVIRDRTTQTHPNGTVTLEHAETITTDPEGTAFGQYPRVELWATEDDIVSAFGIDGSADREPDYDHYPRTKHDLVAHDTLSQGLDEMENVSVTVENDSESRYVLESTEPGASHIENASLRMVVTEDGYAGSYRYEYEEQDGTETMTITTRVTIDRVGDPDLTVDPPAWLSDAEAELENWNASETTDG